MNKQVGFFKKIQMKGLLLFVYCVTTATQYEKKAMWEAATN